MIKIGFSLLVFWFMSFTWAEARRQVRDLALKDFPAPCRSGTFTQSTAQGKIRSQELTGSLWGLPGSQSSIPNPLAPPANPKFTPALLGSQADIRTLVIIPLWREDSLLLASPDKALWLLLQACKIYCSALGRHLFSSDLWTLLASGRAISSYCSLW